MLVYKYTRFKHAESILRGVLAFPRSNQLNDPFESSIESTLASLRGDFQKISYLEREPGRAVRLGGVIHPDFINTAWDDARSKREHNAQVDAHNQAMRENLSHLEWCRDNLGICSLAKSCEDVVMWAHYGQNGTGICIGFKFEDSPIATFRPSDERLRDHSDLFAPTSVKYEASRPSYAGKSAKDYVRTAFFTKYARWSYEEEVRLLRPLSACRLSHDDVALYDIPVVCIFDVVLGANASDANARLVSEEMRKLPNARLRRVRVLANEYKLVAGAVK
jgi:hypothetical protein